MERTKSMFLLIILAGLLFPWQALHICLAHPGGHEHHHEPGEPSPCEMRAIAQGDNYWPPMACETFTIETAEFKSPQVNHLKPTIETVLVAAVLSGLTVWPESNHVTPLAEISFHNTDPPDSVNPLRGPPMPSLIVGREV